MLCVVCLLVSCLNPLNAESCNKGGVVVGSNVHEGIVSILHFTILDRTLSPDLEMPWRKGSIQSGDN